MKFLTTTFLIFSSILSFGSDTSFIISGKLQKLKKGKVFLSYYYNEKVHKDSAMLKDGKFSFKGHVAEPVAANLTHENKRTDYFTFIIEPGKVKISGAGDSLKLLKVIGSPVNDDDVKLKEALRAISDWEAKNGEAYSAATKSKNKAVMDSLDEVDYDVLREKRLAITEFVKVNPSSLRAAMAVRDNYSYYAEAIELEPVYDLFTPEIKRSKIGEAIQKMITVYRTVAVGKTAPEFVQITPEGKEMPLTATRGKYVLVDFWASWCGPCRRENPNIVNIYNRYKDRDFTVFGVSYDSKKDRWEKAIKDDSLTWAHVSDLKGWKNGTSELYGIKAIPSNLILDKDGVIIAKNLFGRRLAAKVEEIMK
jgi:thiol-disulfide isomerase/thioredoxin